MSYNNIITHENLPDKSFFKSQEVANFLMVKPHILSYWEAEFNEVKSHRNRDGQKLYRREDVILLKAIKHLLYEKKFTVAGARKILRESDSLISFKEESFNEVEQKIYENTLEDESSVKKLTAIKDNLLLLINVINEFDKKISARILTC